MPIEYLNGITTLKSLSYYSDERLIRELEKRGYEVVEKEAKGENYYE